MIERLLFHVHMHRGALHRAASSGSHNPYSHVTWIRMGVHLQCTAGLSVKVQKLMFFGTGIKNTRLPIPRDVGNSNVPRTSFA